MNSNYMGIVLGGIVPAIIFGIGGIFVKASNQQGISVNYFTLISGIGAVVISIVSFIVMEEKLINIQSGVYAFFVGVTWAGGILFVIMALAKYNTPISIISPLNCTACLVTVLLALLIFSEWKEMHVLRLLIGTILIIMGAMLVSTSSDDSKIQKLNVSNNQLVSK
jgi:drug/metabolite transporter (DMT)-like permease